MTHETTGQDPVLSRKSWLDGLRQRAHDFQLDGLVSNYLHGQPLGELRRSLGSNPIVGAENYFNALRSIKTPVSPDLSKSTKVNGTIGEVFTNVLTIGPIYWYLQDYVALLLAIRAHEQAQEQDKERLEDVIGVFYGRVMQFQKDHEMELPPREEFERRKGENLRDKREAKFRITQQGRAFLNHSAWEIVDTISIDKLREEQSDTIETAVSIAYGIYNAKDKETFFL